MEVVLDRNKPFYVLAKYAPNAEVFLLFDNQDDAVRKIGEYLKADIPTDQITLLELSFVPNGLSTNEIEWTVITNKLVRIVGLK